MEKRQTDVTQKRNMFRDIQTKKCVYMWNKWTGWKATVCSNWKKMAGDEAGSAIGKLYSGWATKIVWVDCSAEPFVAHWDGEMANKSWKRKMFRHVKTQIYTEWTDENAVSNQTKTKWLEGRQVMQWANCAPVRQLKMGWWITLLSFGSALGWRNGK